MGKTEFAGVFVCIAVHAGLLRADPRYFVSSLPSPNGAVVIGARDLNDQGQIIGSSWSPQGGYLPLLWNQGQLSILEHPSDASIFAEVQRINNMGQIVGTITQGDFVPTRAATWTNGVLNYLPADPTVDSRGWSINNQGQVVGGALIGASMHPSTWNNGQLSSLGISAGDYSYAVDINEHGNVVAMVENQNAFEHGVFLSNGSVTDLGSLGGGATDPYAMNDSDDIVGMSYTADSKLHAFHWANGIMTDLGALPGYSLSLASDVNDSGQIVGDSNDPIDNGSGKQGLRAVLWDNSIPYDLNDLIPANSGWFLRHANAINSAGQIVGDGFYNGQPTAFLLTPDALTAAAPEPSSIVFFGLPWLLLRRKRNART